MMLFLSLLFVLLFFVLTRLVFLMSFKNSKLKGIILVQDDHYHGTEYTCICSSYYSIELIKNHMGFFSNSFCKKLINNWLVACCFN